MTLLSLPRTSLARFVIYSMLNWSTIVLVTVGVWSIFRGRPRPPFLFLAPDVVFASPPPDVVFSSAPFGSFPSFTSFHARCRGCWRYFRASRRGCWSSH